MPPTVPFCRIYSPTPLCVYAPRSDSQNRRLDVICGRQMCEQNTAFLYSHLLCIQFALFVCAIHRFILLLHHFSERLKNVLNLNRTILKMKEKLSTLLSTMEETALRLFMDDYKTRPYSDCYTGARCGSYFRMHQ